MNIGIRKFYESQDMPVFGAPFNNTSKTTIQDFTKDQPKTNYAINISPNQEGIKYKNPEALTTESIQKKTKAGEKILETEYRLASLRTKLEHVETTDDFSASMELEAPKQGKYCRNSPHTFYGLLREDIIPVIKRDIKKLEEKLEEYKKEYEDLG